MKTAKIFGAAAALSSVSAWAHPGHEHHALQSSTHVVADSLLAVGVVAVAVMLVRAWIRRNES